MTDCNWAEKVSLLIDGELASEEARAVELHLGDCFACRLTREDFLLLRHQLSSYRPEVNLLAQRRALENILNSGAAANANANSFAGANDNVNANGRRASEGNWRERAARLFRLPRLGPALVAASALLLVAFAAGWLVLRRDELPPSDFARHGQQQSGPAPQSTPQLMTTPQSTSQSTTQGASQGATPEAEQLAGNRGGRALRELIPDARGGEKIRPKGGVLDKIRPKGSGAIDVAAAEEGDDLPLIIPRIPAASDAAEEAAAEVASAAAEPLSPPNPATLSASRHAEQAQQLLRSFRNAEGDAADLSYERERSQELLYQNIVLRREAASRGNVAVESVLGSLEPILVDIANLPAKPAREDVRTINERMKKKDIVAMLQIAARD